MASSSSFCLFVDYKELIANIVNRMTSLETALNNLASAKQMRDDDEAKPYKCNICKVAYNQSSTLDIHIRSVLHQGRAAKLQELAMTGQIDLSKPLIEQPDSKQVSEHQRKILQEMMSPKSLNSSGSSAPQSSPTMPNQSSASLSPMGSPLLNIQQALMNNNQNGNPARLLADLLPPNSSQQQMLQLLQALPVFQNLNNQQNRLPAPAVSPQAEDVNKTPLGVLVPMLQNSFSSSLMLPITNQPLGLTLESLFSLA